MFQISPAQIFSLKNTDSAFIYRTTTSTRTKKQNKKKQLVSLHELHK